MTGPGRLAVPALLAFVLAAGLASPALARDAACRIEQNGRVALDRTCDFLPDGRDGSFGLSGRGGSALFGPIVSVSVTIIEPGLAEVRGLTRDGINSRWGTARRSVRDRACWEGADFVICAR